MQYAQFWRRFVASLIDGVIVTIIAVIFGLILGLIMGGIGMTDNMEPIGRLLGVVTGWLYFAYLESSPRQATIGKSLLQIKVADLQGARISFARASGRHFGKFLSTITLFIGFIMAAFTAKKQALHDILAGCLILKS